MTHDPQRGDASRGPGNRGRGNRGPAVLIAAGVLTVGVALTLRPTHPPSAVAPPPREPAASIGAVRAAVPDRPLPRPPRPRSVPDPNDGPATDTQLQAQLDPAATRNLPAADARRLTALARAVLTADITGAGRGAFPGYWPTGPTATPGYRTFHIQAAAARAAAGGLVTVQLLWSAEQLDGHQLDRQPATVVLRAAAGRWEPVHPWQI